MGYMPVRKLLLSMSWPSIISMTVQALYNVVDSIFVSYTGEEGLTALSLIYPMQLLMISVGVGTGVGVNSLIARRLGAGRYDEADDAASCGMMLSAVNWIIFAVIGLFFSVPFMKLFSGNAYIIREGGRYLVIILTISLFLFIDVTGEKILQSTGDTKTPMFCALTGQIVNVIFDPILIFGLAGFPEMGVTGAAAATVFGQFCETVVIIYILKKKSHEVTVKIRRSAVSKQVLKDIYAVGAPSMIMQSITSVMQFGMNLILAGLSSTAVAVMGVYGKLQSFAFMPCFGLSQGFTPIVGYNYGARDSERIKQALKEAYKVSFTIMTAALLIFELFPHQLLSFFNATGPMYEIGVPAVRIMSICYIPAAYGIVCGAFFGAIGRAFTSLWGSLLRELIGILPLAYLLAAAAGLGAVWWSLPLAEVIGTVFYIVMMKRVFSNEINMLKKPENY